MNARESFPVVSASALPVRSEERRWLIENLWPVEGVGIIGGAAKSYKTWLALDLAVSLASKTPCLGRFGIPFRRRVLVYAAEDSLPDIRHRLASICTPRGLCLNELELGIIAIHRMHLNLTEDLSRLTHTIAAHQPALLILDPFVRLHSAIDENSSSEVSSILGKLRALQREYRVAIALVHHARKHRSGLRPGQSLRGSTDFHAWTDVTLYMQQKTHHIELAIEHRTAASPEPWRLTLSDPTHSPHLAMLDDDALKPVNPPESDSLEHRLLEVMNQQQSPVAQVRLRQIVKARNQRVTDTLIHLMSQGLVTRTEKGWMTVNTD